jgi:hypothetical protein
LYISEKLRVRRLLADLGKPYPYKDCGTEIDVNQHIFEHPINIKTAFKCICGIKRTTPEFYKSNTEIYNKKAVNPADYIINGAKWLQSNDIQKSKILNWRTKNNLKNFDEENHRCVWLNYYPIDETKATFLAGSSSQFEEREPMIVDETYVKFDVLLLAVWVSSSLFRFSGERVLHLYVCSEGHVSLVDIPTQHRGHPFTKEGDKMGKVIWYCGWEAIASLYDNNANKNFSNLWESPWPSNVGIWRNLARLR